jgi:DNA-binding CsgD family transcriptional regulator
VGLRRADLNQISRVVKYISKNISTDSSIEKPNIDNDKIVRRIKQKQKRLSAEEIAQLISLYQSGMTVYDLADKFDCNRQTVSAHLKANGIKLRRQRLSEKQVDEIIRLYQSGISCLKVGEMLGIDSTSVHNYLVKCGIPRRSTHG